MTPTVVITMVSGTSYSVEVPDAEEFRKRISDAVRDAANAPFIEIELNLMDRRKTIEIAPAHHRVNAGIQMSTQAVLIVADPGDVVDDVAKVAMETRATTDAATPVYFTHNGTLVEVLYRDDVTSLLDRWYGDRPSFRSSTNWGI